MSGIEQSIARDGGIVDVCGKLLKAIIHNEQQAIFLFFFKKRKRQTRSNLLYNTNSLESRDPQRPELERGNPERRVPQCLLSVKVERACRNWTGSVLLEATQSGVPSPKRHAFLGKYLSNLSPSDPAQELRAQSSFVVVLAHQVTTSAESTTGDAPMTFLSPVLACVTTSACVREPRRTCVCTFKIFLHA